MILFVVCKGQVGDVRTHLLVALQVLGCGVMCSHGGTLGGIWGFERYVSLEFSGVYLMIGGFL